MTRKNFKIKWKGSQDLVTLVPYRPDAPEVLKMHLLVLAAYAVVVGLVFFF